MDNYILDLPFKKDGDLNITEFGIAYENDHQPYDYDIEYYEHYREYSNSAENAGINKSRVDLVRKYYQGQVLDIGIGAGDFILNHGFAKGYDINPHAVSWLANRDLFSYEFEEFGAFTMWDTLEHVPEPGRYLNRLQGYLFCTTPIVEMDKIRESKHYKPNEHIYYFTEDGLKHYLRQYGFECLESNEHEVEAGREGVKSFAFTND